MRMASKSTIRPDENVMMMQELEDRLKEQIDKLEHVRLAALDIRENLSAVVSGSDLKEAVSDHLSWLSDLSERLDTLHMNTAVFVQTNPKSSVWSGKHGSKHSYQRSRFPQNNDDYSWSPIRTRRNSDAASEMSCNW
ncbi:hypothetical protein WMY93_021890 [Mugilogobius chulae]|uniref:Uncharacterized protein n=1 Tax=Mugilogobius chulae TaxID=88201 RepID=A0AAW0NDG7_9GOBI